MNNDNCSHNYKNYTIISSKTTRIPTGHDPTRPPPILAHVPLPLASVSSVRRRQHLSPDRANPPLKFGYIWAPASAVALQSYTRCRGLRRSRAPSRYSHPLLFPVCCAKPSSQTTSSYLAIQCPLPSNF